MNKYYALNETTKSIFYPDIGCQSTEDLFYKNLFPQAFLMMNIKEYDEWKLQIDNGSDVNGTYGYRDISDDVYNIYMKEPRDFICGNKNPLISKYGIFRSRNKIEDPKTTV